MQNEYNNLDLFIYDLSENLIDFFINQDTDRYGRITRQATECNKTVDMVINVKTVALDASRLIIEYPNGNTCTINVPSNHYHKMEIL